MTADNYAELVARLRSVVNHKSPEWIKKAFSIIPEAADAITALVKEADNAYMLANAQKMKELALMDELARVREAADAMANSAFELATMPFGVSRTERRDVTNLVTAYRALAAGKGEGE